MDPSPPGVNNYACITFTHLIVRSHRHILLYFSMKNGHPYRRSTLKEYIIDCGHIINRHFFDAPFSFGSLVGGGWWRGRGVGWHIRPNNEPRRYHRHRRAQGLNRGEPNPYGSPTNSAQCNLKTLGPYYYYYFKLPPGNKISPFPLLPFFFFRISVFGRQLEIDHPDQIRWWLCR